MEAATRPSQDQIFTTIGDRHFFDESSPWVPDRDSFDDFEEPDAGIPRGVTPVPGECAADGIATGPIGIDGPDGEPFTQLMPSRYCVRVDRPGFSSAPAVRLAAGRWLLPQLALAVLYEGYFGIDADSLLGSQLFGLQLESLLLGVRGQAVTLSLTAAVTAGRTETTVEPRDPDRPYVNALSGPLGARGGALLRVWPMRRLALLATTTLGGRFPAGQVVIDLSTGVEVPF
jgi:hypothetical protein